MQARGERRQIEPNRAGQPVADRVNLLGLPRLQSQAIELFGKGLGIAGLLTSRPHCLGQKEITAEAVGFLFAFVRDDDSGLPHANRKNQLAQQLIRRLIFLHLVPGAEQV